LAVNSFVKFVQFVAKRPTAYAHLDPEIPDVWAVGYGLDCADMFRPLPYIAALKREG